MYVAEIIESEFDAIISEKFPPNVTEREELRRVYYSAFGELEC